jgi:hypothetical protein
MRTDILTTFKKAINNAKAIERYLEKCSEKSFVKYSMLKDSLREIKDLKARAIEAHEEIGEINETYILKGIEFEYEVRSFYDKKIKYYRWLLDL